MKGRPVGPPADPRRPQNPYNALPAPIKPAAQRKPAIDPINPEGKK